MSGRLLERWDSAVTEWLYFKRWVYGITHPHHVKKLENLRKGQAQRIASLKCENEKLLYEATELHAIIRRNIEMSAHQGEGERMSREVKWADSEGREVLALYHPGVGLEVVEVREPKDETGEHEGGAAHQREEEG